MKDMAPNIYRQRFLIEGYYTMDILRSDVERLLRNLASHLELKIYGDPVVYSPGGDGKDENQGYDAFVPLIDSGISAYIWTSFNFFSIVLYSCKNFDEVKAETFIRDFFNVDGEVATMSF